MSKFKSKEFLDLKDKWDAKLKDSGFVDIEQDETRLINLASNFFRNRFNATKYEAKVEYYQIAGQFLHGHKFKNKTEKLIWALHSDGKSIREIVEALDKEGVKTYKDRIHKILKTLSKEMITHHVGK